MNERKGKVVDEHHGAIGHLLATAHNLFRARMIEALAGEQIHLGHVVLLASLYAKNDQTQTQLAQTSMTKGLQVEKTGRATMVGYVQIIFAGAWGALLFGEAIALWTVFGALIVLTGMLSLILVRREAVGIDE